MKYYARDTTRAPSSLISGRMALLLYDIIYPTRHSFPLNANPYFLKHTLGRIHLRSAALIDAKPAFDHLTELFHNIRIKGGHIKSIKPQPASSQPSTNMFIIKRNKRLKQPRIQ